MAIARFFIILAVYLLAADFATPAFAAEPAKIALIITNQAYDKNPGPLDNPHRDGTRIATALQAIGFKVVHKRDVTKAAMDDEIVAYAGRLAEAGKDAVGFFYYSGHGAAHSVSGDNYLIPVGAAVRSDLELPIRATKLDLIVETIKGAGTRTNFVVFDACRDAALAFTSKSGTKGLRREERRPGMLIAFATEPGATATDEGYYAEALAEELQKPGTEAGQVFRSVRKRVFEATAQRNPPQFPDFLDKRVDDFYFAAGTQTQTAMVAPPRPIAPPTPERAPVTNCDIYGAFKEVKVTGYIGSEYHPADATKAIPACENAIAKYPQEGRFPFLLGRVYEDTKDYTKAMRFYRAATDLNHGGAYANVGFLYYNAFGVTQDKAEAARFLAKAADLGDPRSIYFLGVMFNTGDGVAKDKVQAVLYFRRSADLGNQSAKYLTGVYYYLGDGIPRDYELAARYFREAADAGDANGMLSLARMYDRGQGLAVDRTNAAEWILRMVKTGTPFGAPYAEFSVEFRKELQKALKQEGVYAGLIDGAASPKLKEAVQALAARSKG